MRLSRLTALASLAVVSGGLAYPGAAARADNWPAWRGPTGQGQSVEKNLPVRWSATENVKWKVPLPDPGNSTPIVWGDKVFLTQATADGKRRSLWCLSRKDGAKLWERTVEYPEVEEKHATNTYCAESPVTDGERVVASFGSAGVYCYDLDGKELWRRDLGQAHHIWGTGASPIIHRDLVILNFGPGVRSFLVALSKADGAEVWRVGERAGTAGEFYGSWSTPVVAEVKGRTELVVCWPGELKGHDPSTGKVIWNCKGMEKDGSKDWLCYSTPLVGREVIVGLAGYNGAAIGVRAGGTGDVTDTHRLWRVSKGNPQRVGSGVIVGDHVYSAEENGVACIELTTGKEVWKQPMQGQNWGSLVHADGRLYVTGAQGETLVLAAKPELEVIARNSLGREVTRASVVPSDGDLFIRTYNHLWCISEKK
jgi:outer membrane protein assembly factor BamB